MRKKMTTDTKNNESKQQGSRTKEAKREKKITDLQGCRKHKKNQYTTVQSPRVVCKYNTRQDEWRIKNETTTKTIINLQGWIINNINLKGWIRAASLGVSHHYMVWKQIFGLKFLYTHICIYTGFVRSTIIIGHIRVETSCGLKLPKAPALPCEVKLIYIPAIS